MAQSAIEQPSVDFGIGGMTCKCWANSRASSRTKFDS